ESRPLAGLEIHEVGARRTSAQRFNRGPGFVEDRKIYPESAVSRLRSGDRLKNKIDRPPLFHYLQSGRDMGEHAGLDRDLEPQAQFVDLFEQRQGLLGAIRRRIDSDARISATIHEAVEDRCTNPGKIVGWMIRLNPGRKSPRQTDRCAKARD